MKKYTENKKTFPIHGPWDLEKFRAHPLISGGVWGGGDLQFPGLGVPQRKDTKNVNKERKKFGIIELERPKRHIRTFSKTPCIANLF